MSVRNLDSLFDPASVAVIGASTRPASVGATVWRNLTRGGFKGPLYAVNPKHASLDGRPCHARVADLPGARAGRHLHARRPPWRAWSANWPRGTRAAVVHERRPDAEQKQAMLDAARPHLLRMLGPQLRRPAGAAHRLNASFAHINGAPGELAFVSQSGALVTAMLDWAEARQHRLFALRVAGRARRRRFRRHARLSGQRRRTRAILLYIESIESPRKFMSAARAAARNKPVIVIKAGRIGAGPEGRRLAHRRAGRRPTTCRRRHRARRHAARGHAAGAVSGGRDADALPGANRRPLTMLTNGGGAGVLAADAAAQVRRAAGRTKAPTLARAGRGAARQLVARQPGRHHWRRAGRALRRRAEALQASTRRTGHGCCSSTRPPPSCRRRHRARHDVRHCLLGSSHAVVMGCWLGGPAVPRPRQALRGCRHAATTCPRRRCGPSPCCNFRRNQAELMRGAARRAVGTTAEARRTWRACAPSCKARWPAAATCSTSPRPRRCCEAYRIPVVATRTVPADPDAQRPRRRASAFRWC
jgi:acetyltransferase